MNLFKISDKIVFNTLKNIEFGVNKMKKLLNLFLFGLIISTPILHSEEIETSTEGVLILSYSNGKARTVGIDQVNEVLRQVGVMVSQVAIPQAAKPILDASKNRPISQIESEKLLSLFSLHRGDLLEQIEKAGREPEAHRGGFYLHLKLVLLLTLKFMI